MLEYARFHHIGFAVNDIEKVKLEYIAGGYTVSETVIEPIQKVYVAYARRAGFPTVELLQPLDETSPIVKILVKNGPTPYHVCYAVDDINKAIQDLRARKFMPLAKPIPGHGLDDALMAFLFKKDVGLVQLAQIKE